MRGSVGRRAHPTLEAERGICAAGHRLEAEAGAAMLEAGGNAVDAAVAAAFVGFVVEQIDCGLGGFARLAAWEPGRGALAYDGYVRAPAAARPDMFEVAEAAATYYGHPPAAGDRARHGALAVATPGAVAALCRAQEELGALPRRRVIEPAIAAAEAGMAFSWRDVLAVARLAAAIRALPETAAVLLPGGAVPEIPLQHGGGDRLDGAALARTLERIAERGADGFYRGPVAAAVADAVQRHGGILTEDDLAAVTAAAVSEEPVPYRGHRVATCLDPVGSLALRLLGAFDLGALGAESLEARHLFAEALGVAFADAVARFGDAELTAGLGGKAHAASRLADLSLEAALPRPIGAVRPWRGTSQMVAADAEGRVCSITCAVGWDYGSLLYVPEAGVFLNNGMSLFDPRPGRPASIAPGKAPLFGAPVLVAAGDGGPTLACAGSGGYRIATAVLHATSGVIDGGLDPEAALELPRVHCQGDETFVDSRIDPAVRRGLAELGHRVRVLEEDAATWGFARACLVTRDPATGRLAGSAEPHWLTAVAGV